MEDLHKRQITLSLNNVNTLNKLKIPGFTAQQLRYKLHIVKRLVKLGIVSSNRWFSITGFTEMFRVMGAKRFCSFI